MKAAIVSSVSESCGNAAFTQVLLDTLNTDELNVSGVRLNLDLTQATDPLLIKMADLHIKQIAQHLADFDAVNLQYEPGLYGPNLGKIYQRLRILLRHKNNYVVTIHSTRLFSTDKSGLIKPFIKTLMRMKPLEAIRTLSGSLNSRRIARGNRACIKLFIKSDAHLIVHTQKSANLIKDLFNYERVSVHPLKFVETSSSLGDSEKWKKQLGLSEEHLLVGVFGYISTYKGHETAILALSNLPKKYVLLIAGRQHPQTVRDNAALDPFLHFLISKIEEISVLDYKQKRTPLKHLSILLGCPIRKLDKTAQAWPQFYSTCRKK
jgi:glycosyltransferase involved in cell wall biosynthesis